MSQQIQHSGFWAWAPSCCSCCRQCWFNLEYQSSWFWRIRTVLGSSILPISPSFQGLALDKLERRHHNHGNQPWKLGWRIWCFLALIRILQSYQCSLQTRSLLGPSWLIQSRCSIHMDEQLSVGMQRHIEHIGCTFPWSSVELERLSIAFHTGCNQVGSNHSWIDTFAW